MGVTYLETTDGSCKFWQVEVSNNKTHVRFGKVGNTGRSSEKEHKSKEDAENYAEEQTQLKIANGYAKTGKRKAEGAEVEENENGKEKKSRTTRAKSTPAEDTEDAKPKKGTGRGKKAPKEKVTKKHTRKVAEEVPEFKIAFPSATQPNYFSQLLQEKQKKTVERGPAVWEVPMPATSFGIYIDEAHVYTGSESGQVQQIDRITGVVKKQYKLPKGVTCIVGDGPFLYVGCKDGTVYDISHTAPRLVSQIEEFSAIYWLNIRNGLIAASDASGKIALINTEGETVWVQQENAKEGWMCRIDDTGVYHGHMKGVTKRSLTNGDKIWESEDKSVNILFGLQDEKYIYASSSDTILKLDKETGKEVTRFPTGGACFGISSKLVVASDPFTVYDLEGTKLHEIKPGDGDSNYIYMSMATWGEYEVYCTDKKLVKYDLSNSAFEKLEQGCWSTRIISTDPIAEITPETSVAEVTDASSGGILCECVKDGSKLRVRVIAAGYDSSKNVQFPRAIREEGAKYVVEKIVDQGGFYRAWGDIKKVKN